MEDLGNININIRDTTGGGGGGGSRSGGSGQAGGGPSVPPQLVPPPPPPPPPPVQVPPTAGQQGLARIAPLLEKLNAISGIRSELSGFFSAPSVGGFAQLMSSTSQTGAALGSLTGALGAAVPIIGAAVAVVGGVILSLKAMKAAAERIAERIDAVARFSGQIAYAKAQENLAAFSRQLREAQENGEMYAEVQRLATMAADASADVSIEFNKFATMFAAQWNRIVYIGAKLLYPLAKFLGLLTDGISYIGNLMQPLRNRVWEGTKMVVSDMADQIVNAMSLAFGFGDFWITVKNGITAILRWLGIIADNTKPPNGNGLNAWFMNDVQAITGRRY